MYLSHSSVFKPVSRDRCPERRLLIESTESNSRLTKGAAMKYARIYTDSNGETHFEDVEARLVSAKFIPEAPALQLSAYSSASQVGFLTAPAGWQSEPHRSPNENLYFFLAGEWELTTSDGETRRFPPGSVLRVEDTKGKGHSSRVLGEIPAVLAVVQLAE